jgi:hypothetical protein
VADGDVTRTRAVGVLDDASTERSESVPVSVAPADAKNGPGRLLTVALLLASPLLLVWPLRAQAFASARMIDPYLHTAVIQHGRDLLERFGADNRQFARAGFTVPGRLANMSFGDVGGYYTLRYVLVLVAIVPAFLLFHRLRGPAAGAVAVATIIANPVIVRAWSTDYADASAVSYLIAGISCLVMPSTRPRTRFVWVFSAAVFLCLALNSNFVCLPLVGCALLVYAFGRRRRLRTLVAEGAAALGAFVLTSAALAGSARLLFGSADIWRPTWHAYKVLRSPEQIAVNHTSDWRWVLDTPHVAVPALVLLVWVVLSRRTRTTFDRAEVLLWWMLLLQYAAYLTMQFALKTQVFEFHFYMSMLWAATALVAASIVCEIGRYLLDRPRTSWIPAAALLVVPVAGVSLRNRFSIGLVTAIAILTVVALLVFVLLARPTTGRRLAALAVFVAAAYLIVIGQSAPAPLRPGQAVFPKPLYADVFGHPNPAEYDRYAVVSDLPEVVPEPDESGTPLLMWVPPNWSETTSIAAGQYGWLPNVVTGLPDLTAADAARIRAVRPDALVMIADTRSPLPRAAQHVREVFPRSVVEPPVTLRHGRIKLYAEVVRLTP